MSKAVHVKRSEWYPVWVLETEEDFLEGDALIDVSDEFFREYGQIMWRFDEMQKILIALEERQIEGEP